MKAKYLVGIVGVTVALAAWTAAGLGFMLEVDRATWVVLMVIAAAATEAMIWCMAAALGLTILQARRGIWRWLVQRLTKNLENASRLEK
jgi:hypothetical protein